MPGPAPKPAALRQRTNKKSTRAVLPSAESMADAVVPDLPGLGADWHPMVLDWWQDIWRSPMAAEYIDADIHGLYRLAFLHQDFWTAASLTARLAASVEIRLIGASYGQTPQDRARLQWEIEKGETADERLQRRRAVPKQPDGKTDPRDLLKVS